MKRSVFLVFFIRLSLLAACAGTDDGPAIDLASALERAKKHSFELRQALFDLGTDEARRRMAYRLFLPTLSLSYAQNDSVLYDSPDARTKKISVALSQLVWDRGKRSHALRLKEIDLRIERRLLDFREEDLMLAVVNFYIEILTLDMKGKILEETTFLTREQARIAAEEMRLGDLKEIDYLDILCRAKDLELELAAARQDEARAIHEFGKLLGLGRGETRRPAGKIDENYRGSVDAGEEAAFLRLARKNSSDLEKLDRDLFDLRETLRREERSWMPELTAKLEVSVLGTAFPLTQPGFSLGLDFAFGGPVFPVSAGLRAGKSSPSERFLGSDGEAKVADDLEGLLSEEIARADLAKGLTTRREAERDIEFSIMEDLSSVEHERRALALLEEKRAVMEKKRSVEEVRLEVGDITRIDYVETEIELAKTKIAILEAVRNLFGRETSLRRRCGTAVFGSYPLPIAGGGFP